MRIKRIIGWALMVALFIAIFAIHVWTYGLLTVLISLGIIIAGVGIFFLALYLIEA
jgi:hypothetical protein